MPAGRLTTHVLDVRQGQPARDLAFELFQHLARWRAHISAVPGPYQRRRAGRWRRILRGRRAHRRACTSFVFAAGDYQASLSETGFYDDIPIRFRVTDPAAHYHVPLLLSPFGYSTYRGS